MPAARLSPSGQPIICPAYSNLTIHFLAARSQFECSALTLSAFGVKMFGEPIAVTVVGASLVIGAYVVATIVSH